ncbi:MAG: hypothetical protein Q8O99_05210 [bacterium]|nr:hypothetical protein [bacterium]
MINMYLAIVRHLTDGTQYKNKIRLMFGEPVETHPSESEVYQWSNKIIEASTPLRLFQDIHSLQNQVNEHNPIGEEKTFTLPNGSSFTLGISNVEKDEKGNDKVVALQIYYIDGEISKLFPNIEELLSDMTMKDKFHLFVQFNEHFMEKFITTYDALPSGYTYAVCDPYTKQLLGMTRQGSVVRYGIITHPETLPPSHVISGNVLFEK